MSLIEEALRRTQKTADQASAEPRSSKPEPSVPLPSLPSSEGSSLRARLERGLLVGGSILIAGIVIWEAWVYLAPGRRASSRPIAKASAASSAKVLQTSLSPAPRKGLLQPTLRLSGIVGGPGEPLAIINGTIVRVGEAVAGATLLEVGEDFARLRWRDQDVVLRTAD